MDNPRSMPTKSRFSWRGLTPQVFVLIILPLSVFIVILAFWGLSLHQGSMRTLVGERDERAVRAAAKAISEQLNHREKAVHSLALRATGAESDAALHDILLTSDFLFSDFDYGLALYQRGGKLLSFVGDTNFWATLPSELDSALKTALSRDVPPAFFSYQPPNTNDIVILTMGASSKGSPIAVGAFAPSTMAQQALVGFFTPGEGAFGLLVDSQGNLLYQMGDLSSTTSPIDNPGVIEALAGNSGANYITVGTTEHVIAYSPISAVGWALVIEEPWETVTSPLLRTTENAPLALIPVLFLALVALWLGIRQIVQPLQALETKAAALAWGEYEPIQESVGGIAEIRHLQSELMHLAEKVKSAQESLRGYIGAITAAQEDERRRLARELHDDTLQSLIALNQRVQLAQLSMDDRTASNSLGEIHELTNQTIQNLRRTTRALRPIYLEDLGLVAALEMLAKETQEAAGFQVLFEAKGIQRRLSSTVELALYRMSQEALSNVLRHAKATKCKMELNFNHEAVSLSIADNGQGFEIPDSPSELAPRGHFGLLGLFERAELIGAKLEIQSSQGKGSEITVSLVNFP